MCPFPSARRKLRQLLKGFPIAFMVTVSNGDVTSRPLGVVGNHAFDGTLWFITYRRARQSGTAGVARLQTTSACRSWPSSGPILQQL
jgi:Pyridoxamine 5'-phosphate oxidase like